jgi:hypothetical protein
MRWIVSLLLVATLLNSGCGQKAATPVVVPAPATAVEKTAATDDVLATLPPLELSTDAKYDGLFADAMARLGEGNSVEALAAFEKARAIKDTDLVRGEVERLKRRIATDQAAEQTADTVRFVLKQGRADEAAQLAAKALDQFGGGPAGDTFVGLKRQADALLFSAQDQAAQAERLRREAEAAASAKNLRAALGAYEQALAARPEAAIQKRYDEIKQTIGKYDDLRDQAAVARRDPYRLEEAIDFYRQAGQVWDTPQIRDDIDSCTLALQNRRDRVGIAEFEVRGEVGIPNSGRAIAEELMPAFRGRFDVVERQQLDKVIGEMQLQGGDLWNSDAPRRELGKIAKIRYLVLGSVTPTFGGITVNARMVEAASGLVVQTAKLNAPNSAELMRQLPRLALMLQMSDTELRAYEQTLFQQPPVQVIESGPLPPPPPPPGAGGFQAVAILPYATRPPLVGVIVFEDFVRLPPVVVPGQAAASVSLVIEKDHKTRLRLTNVSVELGDNLFRRGLFREADAQFRVALSLNPGHTDIQLRLNQCQPLLPPPAPLPPPRLRMAVLDFVTPGDPAAVPPGLGPWAAELLAPYYSPTYEVIDRSQVYWYMGRLGLTLRDVIVDPAARALLGQALDARFFVVGTLRPTPAGLETTAHLLDAAAGSRLDVATVVARNPVELKLRLPELARWMLTDPGVRIARQREAEAYQALLSQADVLCTQAQYAQAAGLYVQVLKVRPDDIRIQSLAAEAERNARIAELETRRRVEAERALTLNVALQHQQVELLRASEDARRQAERQAAAVTEAAREQQQAAARERMILQARSARDKQQWKESLGFYETAIALGGAAEIARERETVQNRVAEMSKLRAAEEVATREATLRKQRDDELVRVRQQVDEERRQRDAAEAARRKQQAERDQKDYARFLDNAKKLQDNKRYDDAIDQLNQAKRIRPGAEVDGLLATAQTMRTQTATSAQKAAADKARIDAQAKANAEAAQLAMAQKLVTDKAAREQPKAQTPPPLPKEQPKVIVPPPLPKDQPKEQPKVVTPPPLPKEQPRATTLPPLPKEEPKTVTPPPLPKEQSKATTPPPLPKDQPKPTTPPPLPRDLPQDKAKDQPKVATPPPLPKEQPKKGPPTEYTKKMDAGATAEKTGKYADAQQAYQDALKAVPGDAAATKRAEYAKQMDAGSKATQARKFADAVKAYEAALKAIPSDATATRLLQQAKNSK